MPKGEKTLHLNGLFPDGSEITDYYSNTRVEVHDNKVILNTPFSVVLLGVQSEND